MLKVRNFTVLPTLPEPLKALEQLAGNLYWSWHPPCIELFRRIDARLWEATGHNPVKMIAMVSQERIEQLAQNQGFVSELQRISERLRLYLESPSWFEKVTGQKNKPVIAYFSAEFGLHECLPLYAGGLGVLAGDHLKSASDLALPMVGVGLLYQKGYFRQYLNNDGWQQEMYTENDFYNMPMELICKKNGQPLTISVEYPGRCVAAQIWSVSVGRVKLYLLDTNISANSSTDRLITANLYGGDREMRICQEIMLGIGGYKALRAMGVNPVVCHMNEGHAAFAALERIRELQAEQNVGFNEALEAVKSGNVFTAHTPVKAGLDEFATGVIDKYFGGFFPSLGINRKQFLALGRINPDDELESFKMPVLAIKTSNYRNGVSRLHGHVSRKMWSCLWIGLDPQEVPIKSITNGVHIKSWISDEMSCLYEQYLGSDWDQRCTDKDMWQGVDRIPDERFWRSHQRCKEQLVAFARNRLKEQVQRRGTYHTELNWAEEVLDPEALTIGFARRFVSYKRANLLLKDPKRLVKLLADGRRPAQIIFAGKAHPRDKEAKEIIRQIIHFANQYNVRRRIVFLEDYDINVARMIIRGVDLWLNTPRRPMEASGTSGMKAAMNAALNMSTFDGWWCEGYQPQIGWAIGQTDVYGDQSCQDAVESQSIYSLLENEVIPLFYTRSADGLPRAWIKRVKDSVKSIALRFNTHRMVAEYTRRFYNPAAARWFYMTCDNCARSKELALWQANMEGLWGEIGIEDVRAMIEDSDGSRELNPKLPQLKVGSHLCVEAKIRLPKIDTDDVSVELYYGPVDSWGNIKKGSILRMNYNGPLQEDGFHSFVGRVCCKDSGRQGFAVRILPRHPDLVSSCEPGLVKWETTASGTSVSVV